MPNACSAQKCTYSPFATWPLMTTDLILAVMPAVGLCRALLDTSVLKHCTFNGSHAGFHNSLLADASPRTCVWLIWQVRLWKTSNDAAMLLSGSQDTHETAVCKSNTSLPKPKPLNRQVFKGWCAIKNACMANSVRLCTLRTRVCG